VKAPRDDARERRIGTIKIMLMHPVNRGHGAGALARYVGWQTWRRLVGKPMTVTFWNSLRVRVYPDWPYSWQAIYVRLTEYDDMMFTLRYLQHGDAFVDVGANIGFYSLLASSANGGSPVLAIEPHPVASSRLRENAALNSFANVHVREAAAGDRPGTALLTTGLVDQNRIWRVEDGMETINVPVVTLDSELAGIGIDPKSVGVVKIDTEGFEAKVLEGGHSLLDADPGPVWMVELTGLGARYGSDDEEVLTTFRERGYRPLRYFADGNRLIDQQAGDHSAGNVIFARQPALVAARLGAAAQHQVPAS
jgi:FkbM family methyltransferase